MNELIDIEIVRAEALRKLGRNIVNFSKIEAVLKYLLSFFDELRGNQTRRAKQTLGTLVQEFYKNVVVDASHVETTEPPSNSEISFSFSVICASPDHLKDWKRTFSNVVVERNKLIHQDLAGLDTSCVEDYHKLISLLDEQNPRLLAHLDELGWIIEAVRDQWKAIEKLFESPEFLQHIQSNQVDT